MLKKEKSGCFAYPPIAKSAMDGAPGCLAREENMKANESDYESGDMPPEIDFSGGARGLYAKRYAGGTNLVVIAHDSSTLVKEERTPGDSVER